MKYLKQLNLVPQLDLSMSPSSKSPCHTQGRFSKQTPRSKSPLKLDISSPLPRRSGFGADTPALQEPNNTTDDEDEDKTAHGGNCSPGEYYLNSPTAFSPSSPSDVVSEDFTKALSSEFQTETLYRPLPEVPSSQSRPQSASSLRSNCPSLTPSLRQYVESEDFDNEEIRLSTAQPLLIPSESMQAMELISAGADEAASVSDYALSSPSSTEASGSPKLPSPAGYIPTTGSVLERHLNQYDSPLARSSPSTMPNIPSPSTGSPRSKTKPEQRTGILNLTEAEWLRHPPSPVKGGEGHGKDPWSRRPRTQPTRSSLDGALRGSNHGPENMASSASPRRNSVDTMDQAPVGNWI